MEVRRLQKTGNNTLIVSLPREWVLKNKLTPGKNVFIFELDEGSLLLRTKLMEEENTSTLNMHRTMEWTMRNIISKYIQGYEKIIVRTDGSWKTNKKLKDKLFRILPGIDVVEKGEDLIINVVVDVDKLNLEEIIKRNVSILVWMIKSIADALINGDQALLREVESRDDEIDKMTLLGSRQINEKISGERSTIKNLPTLLYYKSILEKLESMGDSVQVVSINAMVLLEHGIKIKPMSITKSCEHLVALLKRIPEAMKNKDVETGNYMIDESKRYVRDVLSKMRVERIFVGKETPKLVEASALMVENLGRVAQICREVGELIIDFSS